MDLLCRRGFIVTQKTIHFTSLLTYFFIPCCSFPETYLSLLVYCHWSLMLKSVLLKFCSHSCLKIFLLTFTLKYHFLLYLKFHVQNYYFFITLKRLLYCLLSCSWEDWCHRLIQTQKVSKMWPGLLLFQHSMSHSILRSCIFSFIVRNEWSCCLQVFFISIYFFVYFLDYFRGALELVLLSFISLIFSFIFFHLLFLLVPVDHWGN